MLAPLVVTNIADHLSAVVDGKSYSERVTGESAEVGYHPLFKQKSMECPTCDARIADHLAAVVDARSTTEVATRKSAEVKPSSRVQAKNAGRAARRG